MIGFLVAARVLTLAQALETAAAQQPQIRQAVAGTDAARARADEARAPLLPQVNGTATYQRTTANFAPRPGSLPSGVMQTASTSLNTYDYFNFSLGLTQTLFDLGAIDRYRAARATIDSNVQGERTTRLAIEAQVRTAYFNAHAQRALVEVGKETLANQEKHLAQIEGFVRVGTRPEIDLAQARTDRANARVALINAENGYLTAKAVLNQAMGVEHPGDYDVTDETLTAVPGEEGDGEALVDEAARGRPELAALEAQIKSQQATLRSQYASFGPTLGLSTALTDAGVDVSNLAWNWNLSISASWALFSGLSTYSSMKEARANLAALEAQRDAEKLQVRLDVEQARLAVRAQLAALAASEEALTNAREQLRLAEGRYQAGVGNVIELGDAQVALTNASAQKVQAQFNVGAARAQLLKALGR